MDINRTRSISLIFAALTLIAAGLACGRQQGGETTATPVVVVATPTPGGVAQATTTPQPTTPSQPAATSEPTSTPIPGGCADGMQFVADVSVPDGSAFAPNEHFIKTWRIRNSGSCAWSGYHVVFAEGEPMGTLDQPIPDTPAGEELDISIEMTAPGGAGNYTGRWRVQSPGGATLGTLTCVIVVQEEGGGGPSVEPTDTPVPTTITLPGNLQATAQGAALVITWSDASGEADYVLTLAGRSVTLPADTTSYTWENPPCGVMVSIGITARDANGAELGGLSDMVSAPPCPEQPQAPAAPSNLRLAGWTATTNRLEWADNSTDEQGFRVYQVGQGAPVAETTAGQTTAEIPLPPCGQAVQYIVRAYNAVGESGDSNTLSLSARACPQAQTITLQSLPAEDGYVRGVTGGESVALNGEVNVGDGSQNRGQQAFFSFDISGIPRGATIQAARLDLSGHTIVGEPFATLGLLGIFYHPYGGLDSGDYVAAWPGGGWITVLNSPPTSFIVDLQQLVNEGAPRYQVRLQFQNVTDNDSKADGLRFPEGGPALTITYYAP